jgi:hypothetical protein
MAESASANRRNVKAPRDPGTGWSRPLHGPRVRPQSRAGFASAPELADDGRDTPRGHAVTVQRRGRPPIAAGGLGGRGERPAPSSWPVEHGAGRVLMPAAPPPDAALDQPRGATRDGGTYVLRYRDSWACKRARPRRAAGRCGTGRGTCPDSPVAAFACGSTSPLTAPAANMWRRHGGGMETAWRRAHLVIDPWAGC